MKYLAAADEQHNRQEATAPENSETANMVNLGINRMQQLVQQPSSNYASTDRDDESVMAATSESEILAGKTRYRARGRKKDNKGRPHRHRAVLQQDIAENFVQGEAAEVNQTNGTSTRPTVHTARSLAAMALPTHYQKMYCMQNSITTRSGRVGDPNGSERK